MPDNSGAPRMNGWARFGGGLIDAVVPGKVFDSHASSFGAGFSHGDWARAFHGDKSAVSRLIVALASKGAGPAGMLANKAYDQYSRKGLPDFMRGGGGQMGPPSMEQLGYTYPGQADAGPPTEAQQASRNAARAAINDSAKEIKNFNSGGSGGMPSFGNGTSGYMGHGTSLAGGGAPGFGWSGTNDVAGTMATMSAMGNFGPSYNDYMTARWVASKLK